MAWRSQKGCGGTLLDAETCLRGPTPFTGDTYGWRDLAGLAAERDSQPQTDER